MEVGQQRIADSHLFGERFVRPDAVHAQAEHLRVELLKLFQIVDKTGVLIRANGAEIKRIKNQDDIALPGKIGKLDFLLILILEREFRSGLSYSDGHEASSGLNDCCQISRARCTRAGSTFALNVYPEPFTPAGVNAKGFRVCVATRECLWVVALAAEVLLLQSSHRLFRPTVQPATILVPDAPPRATNDSAMTGDENGFRRAPRRNLVPSARDGAPHFRTSLSGSFVSPAVAHLVGVADALARGMRAPRKR